MTLARSPAVAGTFYPGDPATLAHDIQAYLDAATGEDAHAPLSHDHPPKAVIVPHAGYVYSAPVAAHAFARLLPLKGKVERVVLLGPCHRVPVRGLALTSADVYAMPMGAVPVDHACDEALLELPQVHVYDATHIPEHSLEVQVPFLQAVLGDFKLLPLVVGDATAQEVADVLQAVWGGDETLIVISSDLSHYLTYDDARAIDQQTCRAIETLDGQAISNGQACGRVPVKGLLEMAHRRGLSVETLDLRNSGDTAGPRNQVVGYGAWAFWERAA